MLSKHAVGATVAESLSALTRQSSNSGALRDSALIVPPAPADDLSILMWIDVMPHQEHNGGLALCARVDAGAQGELQ